jgi:haloalkane dehalogenase
LKNITLLVHDWGGPIGLGFAVRHPERIKKIIITNTAAFASSSIPFRIAAGKIPWLGRKLMFDLNLFAKAAMFMTTTKKLPNDVKQAYLMPFRKKANRIGIVKFVEDIPMGPEHRSYETLIEIEHALFFLKDKPIAIIWGMKDWCFNIEFLNRWRGFYPNADLLQIKNAGHYVLEDAHEEVIPFIQTFLNKNK